MLGVEGLGFRVTPFIPPIEENPLKRVEGLGFGIMCMDVADLFSPEDVESPASRVAAPSRSFRLADAYP